MDWALMPIVWAQTATGTSGTASTSTSSNLGLLALRRWFTSQTLSSPSDVPGLHGIWAGAAGLLALLVVALIVQGPIRALGQIVDLPGHLRLLTLSLGRLKRSGRVVAVTIGMTVIVWTAGQSLTYSRAIGREDLILIMKGRSLTEVTLDQASMAALTPLRDVLGMGSNLLLLSIAALVVFRLGVDRWANPNPFTRDGDDRLGWANPIWMCASIYLIYRFASLAALSSEREDIRDYPWAGCLMIEPVIIPLLMAVCDGFLLAWILVELRNASLGFAGNEVFEPKQAIGLMPAAVLACVAALPARYIAPGVWLASWRLPTSLAPNSPIANYMRWQLTWGLADLQGAALLGVGLIGAVAWSGGTILSAISGFGRLLRAEAGRLLVVLVAAGAASAAGSAFAYFIVLSLPAQPWVLAAADSYAHYATLPVGLLTLAALVELGARSLPEARLAKAEPAVTPATLAASASAH
jgi:hypothetical protein